MTTDSASNTASQPRKISRVGVVAKHLHPEAARLCALTLGWLEKNDIEALVEEKTATRLSDVVPAETRRARRDQLSSAADAIVVLGGDGTLISVCRHASDIPPLIIGVNLGTLGFLTEITTSELIESLELMKSGEYRTGDRRLFHCGVWRNGEQIEEYHLLNDAVITKQALARIFALELSVDSIEATGVRGDGVIVATPGGSTAYSMAAGGSIVHPQVPAMLITPICPHSLTSRPLVVPAESEISLTVAANVKANDIVLTVDGQSGMALEPGDRVVVRTSSHFVQFFKSRHRTYYDILATKLKWAAR